MASFTHTTRLTSPEPTGFEKVLQDVWDSKRDEQVRTYMTLDTNKAFQNFCYAVMRGADECEKGKTKIVYGSYDRTDRCNADGEINKATKRDWEESLELLGSNSTTLCNRLLNRKKAKVIKRGYRTTGVLLFTDGTMEVVDPTKGFRYGVDGRVIKEIKLIETAYVVLAKL